MRIKLTPKICIDWDIPICEEISLAELTAFCGRLRRLQTESEEDIREIKEEEGLEDFKNNFNRKIISALKEREEEKEKIDRRTKAYRRREYSERKREYDGEYHRKHDTRKNPYTWKEGRSHKYKSREWVEDRDKSFKVLKTYLLGTPEDKEGIAKLYNRPWVQLEHTTPLLIKKWNFKPEEFGLPSLNKLVLRNLKIRDAKFKDKPSEDKDIDIFEAIERKISYSPEDASQDTTSVSNEDTARE